MKTRRLFALFICFALILALMPYCASAEGDTAVFKLTYWNWEQTEEIETSALDVGSFFKVGLTFTDIAAKKFRMADITLYFDNTKLQLVNASTKADTSFGSRVFAQRQDANDYFYVIGTSSQSGGKIEYTIYIDESKMGDYLVDEENQLYDLPPELGKDDSGFYYNATDGAFTTVYVCFKVRELGNAGFMVGNENTGIPGSEILKGHFADNNTDWHDIDSSSVAEYPAYLGRVLVSVENPEDILVDWGTAEPEIGLPLTVVGRFSDGTTEDIAVQAWRCENYNPEIPGEYIFTADLTGTGLKAGCKVTVGERPARKIIRLGSVEPITVIKGKSIDEISLPRTIEAEYDYGEPEQVSVEWSCENYNPNTPGEYVFTGTVEGTELKATVTVTVINKVVFNKDLLPIADTQVRGPITYSENNYGSSPVIYASSTAQPKPSGSMRYAYFKFDTAGINPEDIESAKLKLFISDGLTGLPVTLSVYALPDSSWVEGNKDGKAGEGDELTWKNMGDFGANGSVIATYVFEQSIKNQYIGIPITDYIKGQPSGIISFRLQTNTNAVGMNSRESEQNSSALNLVYIGDPLVVKEISPVEVKTRANTAPILPSKVNVIYQDNSVSEVEIVWDGIDPSLYATGGSFKVGGTVDGVHYDDIATVTVLTVKSFAAVERTVFMGNAPELPNTISVVLTDDTQTELEVVWDSIDPSNYASAGNFTVGGTIDGIHYDAIAVITVTDRMAAKILPSGDTYVSQTDATANKGSLPTFQSTNSAGPSAPAGQTREGLIKFDLGSISYSAVISAKIHVFVIRATNAGTRYTTLYRTENTEWDENTAAWGDAPAVGEGIASIEMWSANPANVWKEFDITDYIKAHLGEQVYSFRLKNSDAATEFASKENPNAEYIPYFEIEYIPGTLSWSSVTINYTDLDGNEIAEPVTISNAVVNSIYTVPDELIPKTITVSGKAYHYSEKLSAKSITVNSDEGMNVILLKYAREVELKLECISRRTGRLIQTRTIMAPLQSVYVFTNEDLLINDGSGIGWTFESIENNQVLVDREGIVVKAYYTAIEIFMVNNINYTVSQNMLTASVTAINTMPGTWDLTLIVAIFKNGKMMGKKISANKIGSSDESQTFTITYDLSDVPEGSEVKIFAWENLKSQRPYVKSVKLKL